MDQSLLSKGCWFELEKVTCSLFSWDWLQLVMLPEPYWTSQFDKVRGAPDLLVDPCGTCPLHTPGAEVQTPDLADLLWGRAETSTNPKITSGQHHEEDPEELLWSADDMRTLQDPPQHK